MFARHTQARMKGSGVLAWKSFLDKIHPQLPLTTKESQRLLTALTSSFRKQLDEAHPTNSAEVGRKRNVAQTSVPRPQTQTWHSSASLADKHLASVLTNPLLVKGGERLDYGSAKVELAKNPTKDPIELLEQYHEQHAASVPMAELCLDHSMRTLRSLAPEEQQQFLQKHQPGRRVFLWLLQSGFDNTSSYADNLQFLGLMVEFLVREGREENIWDWIQVDARLAGDDPMSTTAKARVKPTMHAYRWRARLLRALIQTKLDSGSNHGNTVVQPSNLNGALAAFFKACEMKESVSRTHHLYWIPLGPAYAALAKELYRDFHRIKTNFDDEIIDRFMSYVPLAFDGAPAIYRKVELAQLYLIHPTKHTATPAYGIFQDLFGEDADPYAASSFLPRITDPRKSTETHKWHMLLAVTISRLRAETKVEEASWLEAVGRRQFPSLAHFLNRDVERATQAYLQSLGAAEPDSESERDQEQLRVPLPTFA